ncbi:MAG: hypothetical protein RSB55_06090 [Oscillospiraceae bacterium]
MDGKNRTVFVLLIAVVIAAVILSGVGLNFMGKTPHVALPDLSPDSSPPATVTGNEPLGEYVKVDVTPDTVQSVIVTLVRPESYSRTVKIETKGKNDFWGISTASVMRDGGWTQVDAVLENGQTEHSLVGKDDLYVWRGRETAYQHYAADSLSADLAQRIPTYEDILALDKSKITATGYEEKGSLACVYVETFVEELEQYERFWVSVNTGLLVSAETVKNDETVYRMTAYEVVVPAPPKTEFALPDGTVLHTVGEI